ncbi:MAG: lipocalin-like domain-containing protein [Variibacter sp.]|nr:lipocalin-like domain-containing protein [Variibacter sp.]
MKDIVGVWRLVEAPSRDENGEPMPPSYGPKPMGLVMFSAEGRMACVLIDGRPELPPGETTREYTSYCGSYTIEGVTLVTRVDAASDPSRMVDQVRQVRFEGDRLVLTPPPRPWKGKIQHRELIWERLA